MPSAPCACAATSAPYSAASSTAARICSSVNSGAPGLVPSAMTAPVAMTLIRSAPPWSTRRTALRHLVDGVDDADPQLARDDRVDVGRHAGDVAATTGAGDVGAGDLHPRTLDPAGVDRVAQGDVDERAEGADVADGREAGAQRVARVADPDSASCAPLR